MFGIALQAAHNADQDCLGGKSAFLCCRWWILENLAEMIAQGLMQFLIKLHAVAQHQLIKQVLLADPSQKGVETVAGGDGQDAC